MLKYVFWILGFVFSSAVSAQVRIDRKALVSRHNVVSTAFDSLASLSVGNGGFAFTVDVTGLQSFPEAYANGIPLGTQSDWGWHSFSDTNQLKFEEALKEYNFNGKKVTYAVQSNEPGRAKEAANWFRQNPHRLQLGNLGLLIMKKNGIRTTIKDIQNIRQQLHLYTGLIESSFTVEGVPVQVWTAAHQQQDLVSVRVQSPLLQQQRLQLYLRFPYPTGEWTDVGTNYSQHHKHTSVIIKNTASQALVQHRVDTTAYFAQLSWQQASIKEAAPHYFIIIPKATASSFSISCAFVQEPATALPSYMEVVANSAKGWAAFWNSGGAIDFSGSTDKRAGELERRMILSQYLTKLQCAGAYPPQETGLTYNSWYGKPHLEMHWWHGVHFALWGRTALLQKSIDWYKTAAGSAKNIAVRQGYEGIRWQKMTDPQGREIPSSVGAFLIWQQPHFIYFAELLYRAKKNNATLLQYKDLLFTTADFMASYPYYEKEKGRYILGKGSMPAQERFKPEETFNPTFELAYWHWALETAQQWRLRLQMNRHPKWDSVLQQLAPLPVQNGVYLAAESAPDSYTRAEYMTDHPAVLGAYGMLPFINKLDTAVMHRTFNEVAQKWHWQDTWGWDFPMTAMTATRLGWPDKAIDALLMPVQTNTYLKNGHNYQDERLRLYLPGNGGLLTAIAMMVGGYDGATTDMPGIPKNGKWKVKWEGLQKMP